MVVKVKEAPLDILDIFKPFIPLVLQFTGEQTLHTYPINQSRPKPCIPYIYLSRVPGLSPSRCFPGMRFVSWNTCVSLSVSDKCECVFVKWWACEISRKASCAPLRAIQLFSDIFFFIFSPALYTTRSRTKGLQCSLLSIKYTTLSRTWGLQCSLYTIQPTEELEVCKIQKQP